MATVENKAIAGPMTLCGNFKHRSAGKSDYYWAGCKFGEKIGCDSTGSCKFCRFWDWGVSCDCLKAQAEVNKEKPLAEAGV